jgi:hypothetical protein
MARRADVIYRRTQVGTATVIAVGGSAVMLALIGARTGWHLATVAVLVLLVAALGVFCCHRDRRAAAMVRSTRPSDVHQLG